MFIFGIQWVLNMGLVKKLPEGDFGSRPNWDEYFMSLAIIVSRRASCHNVRAGSVFADPDSHRLLGTGYNGAPPERASCLVAGCNKAKKNLNYEDSLNTGECIGIHGEVNAEGHLSGLTQRGATLYTTISPCYHCSKTLAAWGVKRVVFKREYVDKETDKAFRYLDGSKISVEQLDLSLERLVDIIINLPDVKFDSFSKEDFEKGRKYFESLKNDTGNKQTT